VYACNKCACVCAKSLKVLFVCDHVMILLSHPQSLGETEPAPRERRGQSHADTFPWIQPGRSQQRGGTKGLMGGPPGYTEVPLETLDVSAADSRTLSPHHGVCVCVCV